MCVCVCVFVCEEKAEGAHESRILLEVLMSLIMLPPWWKQRCVGLCVVESSLLAFRVLTEHILVYLSSNWIHPSGRHHLFICWHHEGVCACVCVFRTLQTLSPYCLIIAHQLGRQRKRGSAEEEELLIELVRLFIFNVLLCLHPSAGDFSSAVSLMSFWQ